MKTDVIFRIFHGEVIALFPGELGTSSPTTCASYQHIGQHGSVYPLGVMQDSRLARPEEFAALRAELESPPYNYKLRVVKRMSHRYYQMRYNATRAK